MASVTSFIRNTPAASLRVYFDQSGIRLPGPVNWGAPESELVRPRRRHRRRSQGPCGKCCRARHLNGRRGGPSRALQRDPKS
jgi:hypothetical protein